MGDTANAAVSLLLGSDYGVVHHNCEGILLPAVEGQPGPLVNFALRVLG
jgi:hypothetical protein